MINGIADTDGNTMFLSHLINVVSDLQGVSDFINDTPENVFFKDLGSRSSYGVCFIRELFKGSL